MFCSGCGQAMPPGQSVCGRCGRAAVMAPPVPGLMLELESYASKLRTLSIVWFVYGGFSVVFGVLGLVFARAFFAGRMGSFGFGGPWGGHFPFPPFFMAILLRFVWFWVIVRVGLALAAGWGLAHRAPWGRVVAIVSAFWNVFKFPFGTAIGIWTLVVLLGYRNATLYNELPEV